jgi:hypothetical protein
VTIGSYEPIKVSGMDTKSGFTVLPMQPDGIERSMGRGMQKLGSEGEEQLLHTRKIVVWPPILR